jgi:uncharacterized protein YmfQ (DUF2313 family)
VALRTADDYHKQLRLLLPPGPAWDRELNLGLDSLLRVAAELLGQEDLRASDLLAESDPATLRELVVDWERVMQLPDACMGESPTFDDRQLAVRRRMIEVGGQSPAYFVELAISRGYPHARVIEHRAPRFGRSRFGAAHFGTWVAQFMWTLDTGPRRRLGRRFGVTHWGERWGGNPSSALVCVVRRAAPAHAVEFIKYGE